MPRIRLAVLTLLACGIAAVVGLALARGGSQSTTVSAQTGFAGALRPPGVPRAAFALDDERGQRVDASALRGRPAVVSFMYSTCRDTCPLIADQIRGALDDLPRAVGVVLVSVDPRGDTPLNAKRFLARHGLTGRAHFLLGTRARLAPVWHAFGVRPQAKGLEHSASTVLLDARGIQRVGFGPDDVTPEGLAHDLRRLGA